MAKRKHNSKSGVSHRAKKRKKVQTAQEDTNIKTVKCALQKRCKNEDLYNRIQLDVSEMSALAVEASIFINYDLSRRFANGEFPDEKIPFGRYFRALLRTNADNFHLEFPDYHAIRPNNLGFYDGSIRNNIIQDQINQYETAFHNNLKLHAWDRLRRFFKYVTSDQTEIDYRDAINDTLHYLFYHEDDEHYRQPHQLLLDLLELNLDWDGAQLYDIDDPNEYHRHVYLFHNLQRVNETERLKNFELIPQPHFGSKHIQYDTQQLFELLRHMRLIRPSDEITPEMRLKKNWFRDFVQQNEYCKKQMWTSFFKVPETCTNKFRYSLKTDGVAVSFSMSKKVKQPNQLSSDDQEKRT